MHRSATAGRSPETAAQGGRDGVKRSRVNRPEAKAEGLDIAPRWRGCFSRSLRATAAHPTDGRSMIKLMDRQLIAGFFKSYFVCLTSLLSLYVVVDLFTNLDDFTHHHKTFLGVLQHVSAYYGFRLTKIFDQLCEPIVLLAAMFTMAWMQRCNEQFPLLSAGVSTRRIVLPVLGCAAVMLSLAVLNQEFVIPQVADQLTFDKDDPGGEKELSITGKCYEPNGIHIGGKRGQSPQADGDELRVRDPRLAGRQHARHHGAGGRVRPPARGSTRAAGR